MVSSRHSFISGLFFCVVLSSLLLGTMAGFTGGASLFGFILILTQLRLGGWATPQVKTVVMGFVIGGAWEGIVVHQGWVSYEGTSGYHALPWWMLVFWMAVSTLLTGALSRLKGHTIRPFLLGSCLGPLFALAGEHMGILTLADPDKSLQALALGWGIVIAVLTNLAVRYANEQDIRIP